MWHIEEKFQVVIGGTTFINTPNLVVYDGTPLFIVKRHDNGYLGIDFDIYDATGKKVATVRRNQIYEGDKTAYAVKELANRYTLTEKASGRVLCDIKKREDAKPAEIDVSVKLYTPDGFLFDATPEGTNIPGAVIKGMVIKDCGAGIVITRGTHPK